MSEWGRRTFGDPCRECAYDWSLSHDEVCALVRGVPDNYANILQGRKGTERIEELNWTAVAYVCHVIDNLRIWAERLAAASVGIEVRISTYDNELLAAARNYAAVPLPGALWSLGRAVDDWLQAVTAVEQLDVVLFHPERGAQTILDTIRNNAHDAFHHGWDLTRIVWATVALDLGTFQLDAGRGNQTEPRPALTSDLFQVQLVVQAAYEMYLARMERPPAALHRDYLAAIEAGSMWVIGEPLIGVLSLTAADESLLVENVAVHPSSQGTGHGRRLMEFAEAEARRRNLRTLRLYTNEVMTENIAIYEHFGYVEVGRGTEDGYQRVFMEKPLSKPD